MIVCAGRSEIISCATPIGVGLVEASMGLMKLCLQEYVDSLIFVGSAGSYCYELPLLSLCMSTRATQIESSFIFGDSYTPLDNYIEDRKYYSMQTSTQAENEQGINIVEQGRNVSQETLRIGDQYLYDVVVNSSNYITTDSKVCAVMCRTGIMIENMEFFAFLRVAQEFNIPAYGVFCLTNYCDKNAQKDFIANHNIAKKELEHFIQAQNL